jgi:hypothetical protein
MVRTIIKPKNQDISIHVPENYVGRELEVLLYPVDEITEQQPNMKSISSLRGSLRLTEEEQADLRNHLDEIRNEWGKDI